MSKFEDHKDEHYPKNYFANFSDRLMEKTLEEEVFQLEDYPILSSIEMDKDFDIPSDYFKNFQVDTKQNPKKTFSLYRVASMAATVLLAAFLFTLSGEEKTTEVKTDEDIAMMDSESLDYLMDDLDAIETLDIEDLQEILDYEPNDKLVLDNIDYDIIVDYLIDESDYFDLVAVY